LIIETTESKEEDENFYLSKLTKYNYCVIIQLRLWTSSAWASTPRTSLCTGKREAAIKSRCDRSTEKVKFA